jgi:pre-rRNA-processing protein IPI3
MLPPTGLSPESQDLKRTIHTIVKPRLDNAFADPAHAPGAVPAEYAFNTHILASSTQSRSRKPSQFSQALTHAFFPDSMIEEGLAELAALRQPGGSDVIRVAPAASALADTSAHATTQEDTHVADLEAENAMLKKKVALNDTARHANASEVSQLRSDLAQLQDYINELHEKQEVAQQDKVQRQARKEEREAKRREAWLAAEKKGRNGDAVTKKMEIDDDMLTSESDDQSDE